MLVAQRASGGFENMQPHLVGLSLIQPYHSISPCATLCIQSLGRMVPVNLLKLCAIFPALVIPLRRHLSADALRQVEEYITDQLDARLSLANLAALVHLSPYHFARLFKETTGKTVHEYVLQRRLKRSHEMLLATDLPIGCIANDAGFADESHFVRQFKAVFGLTPGALRKQSH